MHISIQETFLCSTGSSQCCSHLQIASSGLAERAKPYCLGTYAHYTIYNNINVYKHIKEIRFLYRDNDNDWRV